MGEPRRFGTSAGRTWTWARAAERREAKGRESSTNPLESQGDLWTHLDLWVTTLDVNLGKLVLLEVHGRLRNVKIKKKYFLRLEWGSLYTIGKLKRRAFQKLKNTQIWDLVREIWPREVSWLRVWNSRECPRSIPERPPRPKRGGFLQRAAEAYVWKVVSLTPARPLWIPFGS